MKPRLENTQFGSVTIDGQIYLHDVLIHLDGTVAKRKKKLSKEIYGTSHIISLAEAEFIYEEKAEVLVIGGGQFGMVKLSEEAARFFEARRCRVVILPTPEALDAWNQAGPGTLGLFHVTC
jgi:hypothetical protein